MTRVFITEDQQIYAVWTVQKGNRHREYTVPVSETLRAQIMGRASVQTMIDNVRDDTKDRTGT